MIYTKKTIKPIAIFGVLAVVLIASGCQETCTGDARFDGYHCARSNISHGVYDQQTAQLNRVAQGRGAAENTARGQYNTAQNQRKIAQERYRTAQTRLRTARSNPATPTADVLRLEREVNSLQRALDQYGR